ncbi:MAG: toprim domain-containing protein [Carboxylicivirga sp.]|jgi:DNA primase|nr:toprim domain-containing protein [Carboxylicivirga sp.]
MNCSEANNYSIVEWLQGQGIAPARIKQINYWYPSPFRKENDPSFKVDNSRNIWYDYGMGVGGRLIDLVCWLHRVNVSEALQLISGDAKKPTASLFFHKQEIKEHRGLEITNVCKLKRSPLIQYLRTRLNDVRFAGEYVSEVSFIVGEKKYYAIGFKNDKGGYELRNKYFKGCSSPKHITTIPGRKDTLNIFEGFMDYLTALSYFNISKPYNKTIVLNSLSHLKEVTPHLGQYKQINLYLDNDKAGEAAAEEIIKNHVQVENYAKRIYPDYKDFNEFYLTRFNYQTQKQ